MGWTLAYWLCWVVGIGFEVLLVCVFWVDKRDKSKDLEKIYQLEMHIAGLEGVIKHYRRRLRAYKRKAA